MQLFENQFIHIQKYTIKGYDYIFFSTENELINTRTNNILKNRVKGTSLGYEINGKWITNKKITELKIIILKLSKKLIYILKLVCKHIKMKNQIKI